MLHPTDQTIPTVTVTGYFGKDKQITRKDYVETWKSHGTDLYKIAPPTADGYNEVTELVARITLLANREFDRLYSEQHS